MITEALTRVDVEEVIHQEITRLSYLRDWLRRRHDLAEDSDSKLVDRLECDLDVAIAALERDSRLVDIDVSQWQSAR